MCNCTSRNRDTVYQFNGFIADSTSDLQLIKSEWSCWRFETAGNFNSRIYPNAESKRLSELEDEIGTKLLVRNGREMQLTEAGAFLYQPACAILRNVADTCRETMLIAHNEKKILKIGVSYLYENYFNAPAF